MARTLVVTGAGGGAAHNVAECLNRAFYDDDIVGVDVSEHGRVLARGASQFSDVFAELPHGADVVFPQPDEDVRAFATKYVRGTALPSLETVEICQDKYVTSKILGGLAVGSAPASDTLSAHRMLRQGGIWARARSGAGCRMAMPIGSMRALYAWLILCEERGVAESEMMIAPELLGREFAWQGVYWRGELVASYARERVEHLGARQAVAGRTSTPSVQRVVHDRVVNDAAERAVQLVCDAGRGDPHGVFGVDMRCDDRARPRVTEINAGRFFTTIMFGAWAGANLPAILARHILTNGDCARPARSRDNAREGATWHRGIDRTPVFEPGSDL